MVLWWWLLAGIGLGLLSGFLPGWVAYWRLRFLLWQIKREATAQLAAMKAHLVTLDNE